MVVGDATAKFVALTPLNFTAVAPTKFRPVMFTIVPTGPLTGEKPETTGAATKFVALVAVPPGVVTVSGPVVAFAGTVAWIVVIDGTTKFAAFCPLNLTAATPLKF